MGPWPWHSCPMDVPLWWVAQEPDLSLLWQLGIVNITSDKMVEDMTINDEFSTPLIITIITLAGSLLLVAAIYGCHQRFSQKKDQVRWQEGGTGIPRPFPAQRHLQEMRIISAAVSAGGVVLACPVGTTPGRNFDKKGFLNPKPHSKSKLYPSKNFLKYFYKQWSLGWVSGSPRVCAGHQQEGHQHHRAQPLQELGQGQISEQ